METSPQQLCDDLMALFKRMKANTALLAERHDLTPMQLYVLGIIHREEMTMGKVAENLHCDASNVTGIIDRLVVSGLVSRRESEQDRRTKVLHLTEEGERVLRGVEREMPAALGCDKLSAAERAALRQLLDRMA